MPVVYSDFGKASGNDSKFQERRILFQDPRKEKYSKCPWCTGCTVILVRPLEMIASSRKGNNYSEILERKFSKSPRCTRCTVVLVAPKENTISA